MLAAHPRRRAALRLFAPVLAAALGAIGPAMPAAAQGTPPASPAPAPIVTGFVKETAANLPSFNIYRPADLATRKGPVPVIAWANGACVRFDTSWTPIFQRWAAAGFVVLTVHDAEAAARAAEMGARMAQEAAAGRAQPRDATGAPVGMRGAAGQVSAGVTQAVASQAQAIDWAIAENGRAGSPYAGKLDTARIGVAGNSCGGISSLTLAAKDKRPKSIFVLSGSSVGPAQTREQAAPIMSKVTVPTIWVVGGAGEDVARPAAEMDAGLLPEGTPNVIVYRASGDHRTVSTTPAIQADAAAMGVLWFRATLMGDHAAASALSSTICTGCDPKVWTIRTSHFGSH